MSDGSVSHCKMMSESLRQVNMFHSPRHCERVYCTFRFNILWMWPQDFTYTLKRSVHQMLQHFQNKVVTQNNGKFAVSDDTLDSFAWFCLCFAFDARRAPVFEWDVCQLLFHYLKLGTLAWCGDWLRSCLDKNSVIVNWILNNWLHDCVIMLG